MGRTFFFFKPWALACLLALSPFPILVPSSTLPIFLVSKGVGIEKISAETSPLPPLLNSHPNTQSPPRLLYTASLLLYALSLTLSLLTFAHSPTSIKSRLHCSLPLPCHSPCLSLLSLYRSRTPSGAAVALSHRHRNGDSKPHFSLLTSLSHRRALSHWPKAVLYLVRYVNGAIICLSLSNLFLVFVSIK